MGGTIPKVGGNVLFQLSTDTTQKGLTEEFSTSDRPLGMSVGVFSLMIDVGICPLRTPPFPRQDKGVLST